MFDVSRRSFLAGAATIPFALWLERHLQAQTGPLVRYDARSTQGQANLDIYAALVGTMKGTPQGDPRSWVFQWYTHWVDGSTTKSAELQRIYPSPSPWKELATEMWNTCQAHGPNEPEDFFLPWHRMFVFYFESIIRQLSGVAGWTLPYWNYSNPAPSVHGIIPPQFTRQGDPLYGPLFVDKRNPGVNQGQAIDRNSPGALDPTSALAQCTYSPSGAQGGFNQDLDFGVHGNVHVLVGNSRNMGSVPWAASDPIFWMHHCNIDRLWASWNAAGRKNPTDSSWLNQSFVFADANGQRVVATIKDFTDISKLGYKYQALESVPACPTPVPSKGQTKHAKAAGLTLGAEGASVALTAEPAPQASKASLKQRLGKVATGRRVFLVLKGLQADVQPETLYRLYLELPKAAKAATAKRHLVGTLNFFHAGHTGHGEHGPQQDKFVSFEVTALLKDLGKRGLLTDAPLLTVQPAGAPAADSKPVIGELSLVEQ